MYWYIFGSTLKMFVDNLYNTLWLMDPLLGRDLEMDNEYSRCYAIGG
jgi:hypothetical protein